MGNGTTFPADLVRWEQIRQGLAPLCDSVATRLRKQGLYAGGVSVTLKSADFKTASRQLRLDEPTHLMRIETITSNLQSRVDADIKVKEAASQLKKLEEERQNAARERAHLLYARGGSSPKNVVETRTE